MSLLAAANRVFLRRETLLETLFIFVFTKFSRGPTEKFLNLFYAEQFAEAGGVRMAQTHGQGVCSVVRAGDL